MFTSSTIAAARDLLRDAVDLNPGQVAGPRSWSWKIRRPVGLIRSADHAETGLPVRPITTFPGC